MNAQSQNSTVETGHAFLLSFVVIMKKIVRMEVMKKTVVRLI